MQKPIILQNCGFSVGVAKDDNTTMDVNVQALHTGIFVDMNGTEIIIDKAMLENLVKTYNESAAVTYAIDAETDPSVKDIALEDFDNRNAPNQVNHNATDANLTVGHVVGLMELKEINGKTYLFCKVRVKGEENVAKVRDKRFRNVSMQFNPETYDFVEISWVVKGAAFESHTILGKSENPILKTLDVDIDNILTKQKNIAVMKRELDATKHLIALSVNGRINRVQLNKVKASLSKFNDPKAVIELMEEVLPDTEFKPKVINNQILLKELLKGKTIMPANVNASQSKNPIDALKNAQTVVMGDMGDIQHSNIGKDDVLAYCDAADKHMELMAMSADGYEKGDMEMGRKYGEMAKKLAMDMKGGKAKMSDYDIDKDSAKSDEVKEMGKRIKAAEEEVKKEVEEKLAKFEEKITVMLANHNQATTSEMKDVKDAILLLTKVATGSK
jgi:hypothetical protein